MLTNKEKARRFWNKRKLIYAQLAARSDPAAPAFAWKTRSEEWDLLRHCRRWEPAFTAEIDAKIRRWRLRPDPMSWKRIGARLEIPWVVVRQRGVGLGFPIQQTWKEASYATRQRSTWYLAEGGDADEGGDSFLDRDDSDPTEPA